MFKRKKPGPKKGEGGRPKIEIDWNQIDSLCMFHCTAHEIVDYLALQNKEISYDTLNRRAKEQFGVTFAAYVDQKQNAWGKVKLRQLQWRAAEKGNVPMLIWLGKQWLGQHDITRTELTGKDGNAIQTISSDTKIRFNFKDKSIEELKKIYEVLQELEKKAEINSQNIQKGEEETNAGFEEA